MDRQALDNIANVRRSTEILLKHAIFVYRKHVSDLMCAIQFCNRVTPQRED